MQPTISFTFALIALSLMLAVRAVLLQRRRRIEARHAVLLNRALPKMHGRGWAGRDCELVNQ